MNRLTLLHINIIGAVVVLITGAALYFTVISSANEGVTKSKAEYQTVSDRADKLPGNKIAKANAEKAQATARKEYAVAENVFMPVFGYTNNRYKDMMHIWWPNNGRSWPERFIRAVRSFMAQEARRNGVRWDNPEVLALPSYGADPNTIDMGDNDKTWRSPVYQITVTGRNYPALMNHIQDWNGLHGYGVPVVDNVQLAGNSPNLQASYTVQFTAIMRETEKPAAKMPRISGSGGGSGGGGGGGGGAFGGGGGGNGMYGGGPQNMGSAAMGSGGMMGGARRGGKMGMQSE